MSDNNVSKFLAMLDKGVSKPNLFRVEINLPKGVPSGANAFVVHPEALQGAVRIYEDGKKIGLLTHDVNMPGTTFATFPIFQTATEHPYLMNYTSVGMQIYVDGRFDAPRFFSTWRNMIHNKANNTFNYYDEFVSNVSIFALNERFEDIARITLLKAFPIDLPGMSWAAARVDEMQTMSVGWVYAKFEEEFYDR